MKGAMSEMGEVLAELRAFVDELVMNAGHPNVLDSEEPDDWRKGFDELTASMGRGTGIGFGRDVEVALDVLADRIERLEQGT